MNIKAYLTKNLLLAHILLTIVVLALSGYLYIIDEVLIVFGIIPALFANRFMVCFNTHALNKDKRQKLKNLAGSKGARSNIISPSNPAGLKMA